MTHNRTITITIKNEDDQKFQINIYKRYYQWLCIFKYHKYLKLSMPYNIGEANLSRTWCST